MYQRIEFIGNLGRDPEMRYTPTGQAVTNFSAAVTETIKGEKKTVWIRVTTWGNLAEICNKYLSKGSKVFVEGKLNFDETGNPRVYEKNDHSWGANFEVTAFRVVFLSSKESSANDEEDVPDYMRD